MAEAQARDLGKVVEQLVECAPDLRPVLVQVKQSVLYAAPESESYWWGQTACILGTVAANHPKREELREIFSGRKSPYAAQASA